MDSVYTRALLHPATTLGIITAAIGVGAAITFALAEQRVERGIARRAERASGRMRKRLRRWADHEVSPRVEKYGEHASRWIDRHKPWE